MEQMYPHNPNTIVSGMVDHSFSTSETYLVPRLNNEVLCNLNSTRISKTYRSPTRQFEKNFRTAVAEKTSSPRDVPSGNMFSDDQMCSVPEYGGAVSCARIEERFDFFACPVGRKGSRNIDVILPWTRIKSIPCLTVFFLSLCIVVNLLLFPFE
jgi:hypothetical protein